MTPDTLWQRYADIWSADSQTRSAELQACLHEDCSYCDINGLIEGRSALGGYMHGFQQSVPGARFRILSVANHHDRSLSTWALQGSDGTVLQTGRSFALQAQDGRLRHITGFFDPPAIAADGQ